MKRILSLILACVMILSLVACSSSIAVTEEGETATAEENKTAAKTEEKTEEKDKGPITLPEGYSAGWARATVNPESGTGLGGFSNADERLSKTILDDLKFTVTAVSNGTDIFLFISADVLYVSVSNLRAVTNIAKKNYGIPEENVILNATHTHSAPSIYSDAPGISKYLKKLYPAIGDAMDDAIRDLAPAKLKIGSAHTEGLNYVRRYLSLADGSYLGNWPEEAGPEVMRHETDADTELQVILFDREDKKDIVLCNWQCHTTAIGSEKGTVVSADWVYPLREKVEKDLDVVFSYHQGAAGNLVPGSKITGENKNSDYKKHGQAIAEVVKTAVNSAQEVSWGKFQAKRIEHAATYNERYKKEEKITSKTGTNLLLSVLSIGDVAFAAVPCEYHDTFGMRIKEASEFKMTFICAYSNGCYSYIPTAEACANGGYEPGKYMFEVGTGENMCTDLQNMLAEQHNNK